MYQGRALPIVSQGRTAASLPAGRLILFLSYLTGRELIAEQATDIYHLILLRIGEVRLGLVPVLLTASVRVEVRLARVAKLVQLVHPELPASLRLELEYQVEVKLMLGPVILVRFHNRAYT